MQIINIKEHKPFDQSFYPTLPLATDHERAKKYLSTRFPDITKIPGEIRYDPACDALAIATHHPDTNELIGVKYRYLSPIGNTRFGSQPASTFGGYWMSGSEEKLLIVEAELDAMSARLLGFAGTVLALQTNQLSKETALRIKKFKNVFLCLDNDEEGRRGREQVKSLIPFVETKDVKLPEGIKDLNELLTQRPKEAAEILRRSCQLEHEKKTITVQERTKEIKAFLKDKEIIKGNSTGWASLDRIMAGGLRKKEFTVLNGFFKRGKTTLLTNLTFNMAKLGIKSAVSSFEMDADTQLIPNYLSLAYGEDVTTIAVADVDAAVDGLLEVVPELNNIAIYNNYGKTTRAEVDQWVRFVASAGFELVILDHSGFMLEEPSNANENEKLAEMLAGLAKELNIHVICVVQAPKPAKDKSGSYIQDLSGMTAHGGTAWAKYCSNFMTLKVIPEEAKSVLEISEASRNRHVLKGEPVYLFYDRETGRLTE